jgi:hypothetical protein
VFDLAGREKRAVRAATTRLTLWPRPHPENGLGSPALTVAFPAVLPLPARTASAAGRVVMQGTPCITLAARIRPSSVRAPLPRGVFMISCTRPSIRKSIRLGCPSWSFFTTLNSDPCSRESAGSPRGGDQVKPERLQAASDVNHRLLRLLSRHAEEDGARLRECCSRCQLPLGKGDAEVV